MDQPALGDLAIGQTVNGNPGRVDRPAGGRNALHLALVGAGKGVANNDPILLGDHIIDCVMRTRIACGKSDEGRAILDELLAALPSDAVWSYLVVDIAMVYGELNLASGQPENLFSGLDERIQAYRQAGFGRLLAEEHWLRGRAALALGQYAAARESLLKAKAAAEAQEERAILCQILATMSDLEKAEGNLKQAQKLQDQAREVVDEIAAQAGEMREVFLGRPDVVRLVAGRDRVGAQRLNLSRMF